MEGWKTSGEWILKTAMLAAALLVAAVPAQAGWLDKGIGVGGAAHSVSKNLDETTNLFGRIMKSFIAGDDKETERLGDEIRNVPKNLIVRAFPVLEAANAVVNRVKSAKEKISRFVSGAKEKAVDARAALAVDRDSASQARVMANPLPSPPAGNTFMNRSATPSAPASSSWSTVTGASKPASPPSGEAARVTAFARGCFNKEIDVNDPDEYAQFKGMMEHRLSAGGSLDCAEVRNEEKKAGDNQAAEARTAGAAERSDQAGGGSGEADAVSAWLGEDREQGTARSDWDAVMGDSRSAQASTSGVAGTAATGTSGETPAYATALQSAGGTASDGGYLSALATLDEREAEERRLEEEERARQAALDEENVQQAAASGSSSASTSVTGTEGPTPSAPAPALSPGESIRECTRCPEMVVLSEGNFVMGSPLSEEGRHDPEGPQRTVRIGYLLAVGKYEVTFAEWDACAAGGGCGGYRPDDEGWGRGARPVIAVSWDDAQAYVSWLRRETGEAYRLLTEAEWEYAARAGTTAPFHTGATISTDQANYIGDYTYGSGRRGVYREMTVPVGSFAANAFGLHDVHGNVWEWVEDCWNASYAGAPADGRAWTSGDCSYRVLRGGSWLNGPWNLRSANRRRETRTGYRLAT